MRTNESHRRNSDKDFLAQLPDDVEARLEAEKADKMWPLPKPVADYMPDFDNG